MKHSVINRQSLKEIFSGGRIYTGITKSFCGLPPISPRQIAEAVAYLIGDFIRDKTPIIGTKETVGRIADKSPGRLPTASALSVALKGSGGAGAVVSSPTSMSVGTRAISSAAEAEAILKHSVINFDAQTEFISEKVSFLIDDFISDKKNQLLNFIGRLKIKWRTLTKKFTVPHR